MANCLSTAGVILLEYYQSYKDKWLCFHISKFTLLIHDYFTFKYILLYFNYYYDYYIKHIIYYHDLDFGLYPFCRPKNILVAIGLRGPILSFECNSPNIFGSSKSPLQQITRGWATKKGPWTDAYEWAIMGYYLDLCYLNDGGLIRKG